MTAHLPSTGKASRNIEKWFVTRVWCPWNVSNQLPLKFMRILPFQATGSATFAVKHISLGLIKRWMAVVVYLLNFSEIFSYLINWVGGNTPLHLKKILICRHVILRRKKSLVLYQPNYLVFDSYKLHIFIDNFKLSNWYIKVILDQEFGSWLMKIYKFLNNSVKWFLKMEYNGYSYICIYNMQCIYF